MNCTKKKEMSSIKSNHCNSRKKYLFYFHWKEIYFSGQPPSMACKMHVRSDVEGSGSIPDIWATWFD